MPLRALFRSFPKALLHHDPSVIFALDAGLRLIYANIAWDRFAAANGEEPDTFNRRFIGQPIQAVIPDELSDFYARMFRQVMGRNEQAQHTYECSSSRSFRLLQMRLYPLQDGAGILCVNSQVVNGQHTRTLSSAFDQVYLEDGLINMCSHCRRTRRASREDWDWVPDYLEKRPLMISYGLCPICRGYHAQSGIGWRKPAAESL
jgi:hypothetical protein